MYCFFVSIIKLIFLSNYSNSSFSQSFHRTLSVCGGHFNWETFSFDRCIGFMTIQIFQKVLFNFISLDIQSFKSQPPATRFSPSKSHPKTQRLPTSIELKIIVFLPCIRILLLQKFQREHFNLTFCRYSN